MSKCLISSFQVAVFHLKTPSWSDADEGAAQALEGGGALGIVFSHGGFLCSVFSFLFLSSFCDFV